jgi:hypothetical protein
LLIRQKNNNYYYYNKKNNPRATFAWPLAYFIKRGNFAEIPELNGKIRENPRSKNGGLLSKESTNVQPQ